MIPMILALGADPSAEAELLDGIASHTSRVLDSAGGGDRSLVREVEAVVRADPAGTLSFDGRAKATVRALGRSWCAGRFEIPLLWTLKSRAAAAPNDGARRLFVLFGERPVTDIGALQAFAGPGTVFQVASQFNCLESPGPYVVPVANYLHDPTQGPRASISAFAGTLLRHYAAPSTDGRRFTQVSDGEQVDLLSDVCAPEVARVKNGYLREAYITDLEAFAEALEHRFDAVRVGVHDDVEVALGFNWDGAVEGPRPIAQVFTSTLAAGLYGRLAEGAPELVAVCRHLLRAAYLGTLLATRALGHRTAVLTLIGGGVFGNPIELIWESILWACDEVERIAPGALDVVVNGRNLGGPIDPATLAEACRARGGVAVELSRERVAIHR
jgi:hypothetical protein